MFLNIISGQNSRVKVVEKGYLSAQKSIAIKTAISSEKLTNVMMLIIYNHLQFVMHTDGVVRSRTAVSVLIMESIEKDLREEEKWIIYGFSQRKDPSHL